MEAVLQEPQAVRGMIKAVVEAVPEAQTLLQVFLQALLPITARKPETVK